MFDFEGFGKRIQRARKARGLTQEELADRLGITAQAVSKWENGDSYPDIALIPAIASSLGMALNELFGVAEAAARESSGVFPERYEGLPLVHSAGEVGCYSDKPVAGIDGSAVRFSDGSTAELSTRMVVNKGPGEIQTIRAARREARPPLDYTKTEASYEFGATDTLNVEVLMNSTEVVRSRDGKTRVYAKGSPEFIDLMDVRAEGGALTVRFHRSDESHPFRSASNELTVEVPYERGEALSVSINGQGSFECAIPYRSGALAINGSGAIEAGAFESLSANINGSGDIEYIESKRTEANVNGSGDIEAKDYGALKLNINGSGDLCGGRAESLSVNIRGSGDVELNEIAGGDVTIKIMGGGDVEIGRGECGRFEASVMGSGDVNLEGVTARTAKIILEHGGDVAIGRVLEDSVEQNKGNGTIRVLARGPK